MRTTLGLQFMQQFIDHVIMPINRFFLWSMMLLGLGLGLSIFVVNYAHANEDILGIEETILTLDSNYPEHLLPKTQELPAATFNNQYSKYTQLGKVAIKVQNGQLLSHSLDSAIVDMQVINNSGIDCLINANVTFTGDNFQQALLRAIASYGFSARIYRNNVVEIYPASRQHTCQPTRKQVVLEKQTGVLQ